MTVSANEVLKGAQGLKVDIPKGEMFGLVFTVDSGCDRWVVTDFSLKAVGIVHFMVHIGEEQFGDTAVRFFLIYWLIFIDLINCKNFGFKK